MKYKLIIKNNGNTVINQDSNYKRLLDYARNNSFDGSEIQIINNDWGEVQQSYINVAGRLFTQR